MPLKSLKHDAFPCSFFYPFQPGSEMSFLFHSFVHGVRHKRLLYGGKSRLDIEQVLQGEFRILVQSSDAVPRDGKVKMTNCYCEKL